MEQVEHLLIMFKAILSALMLFVRH